MKISVMDLTKQGLVAAIYVTLCLAFAPLAYGHFQFRFAELLMVLPFFNKKYIFGLTIGCLIANIASPFGIWDIVFGTLATFIACALIIRFKSKLLVAPIAAIANGLIIGALIFFVGNDDNLALWYLMGTVCFGEFVVVAIAVAGASVLEKNAFLKKLLCA